MTVLAADADSESTAHAHEARERGGEHSDTLCARVCPEVKDPALTQHHQVLLGADSSCAVILRYLQSTVQSQLAGVPASRCCAAGG